MCKCMSGFTTDNGKFLMPLQEKFSYHDSFKHCDSHGFKKTFLWSDRIKILNRLKLNPRKWLGLQIHLAQDANEQKLVNSLATYSSSWLRIKFDHDEIKTDDLFQGNAECLILTTSSNNKLLRNDHFWRLDSSAVFKSQPEIRISSQFSPIVLARIGSKIKSKYSEQSVVVSQPYLERFLFPL